MVEKILNININDENSGKIAEILGNKTCKKILSLIAEKDSISEGDIAKQLGIPANTANYNLKKLIAAGFVEETKTWFWSVKGKKIKTYRLTNKKIIISTKKSFKSLVVTSLSAGLVGLLIKLGLNYSEIKGFNSVPQNSVVEKAADFFSSAAPTALKSQEFFVQQNFFQNVLIWFVAGCLVGIIVYLLFKKMKGGKK